MKPDTNAALAAFQRVAEHGSFTRAAAQMGVSTSALSQTIRQLEDALNVQLFSRTTRRVGLTEAGQALLSRITPALAAIDTALEETRRYGDAPGGTLRLTVPRTAATLLLHPHLAAFMQTYPDVRLEIDVDDRFSDLIGGHYDAGLRLGEAVERDMVAIPLGGPLHAAVVGSADYLARHGTPQHPQVLTQHRCLCHRFGRDSAPFRWEFIQGEQRIDIAPDAALIVNDKPLRIRAALDGAGLTYVFREDVSDELASGRLISVLDDWTPSWDGFYLYCPSRTHMAPKLRALIDFLRDKVNYPRRT